MSESPSGLADAVQQQVHRGEPGGAVDELGAADEPVAQVVTLVGVEVLRAVGRERSCAASRKPPVPQAGSTTVSAGPGWMQSTIAEISARGVKYWPAPDLMSSAPLASSSS